MLELPVCCLASMWLWCGGLTTHDCIILISTEKVPAQAGIILLAAARRSADGRQILRTSDDFLYVMSSLV